MVDQVPTIAGATDLRVIASGASGDVYVARDTDLNRTVALKVLRLDLRDRSIRERFQQECTLIGPLSRHPNIVTVYRTGAASDGRPFLAMEDCSGRGSLQAALDRHGPMASDDVLRIGVKLCGALESAHRTGVIHGDVKPANVLVTDFDEPALADFGVSALEHEAGTKELGFSPEYAAPEVLQTGRSGSRSADIYGLAATLWSLLAGHPPFVRMPGETRLAFALRVTAEPVPPIGRSDVPPVLERILAEAMAKKPEARPGRALELADRLVDVERSLGLPVTTPMASAATVPDSGHTDTEGVAPLFQVPGGDSPPETVSRRPLWRRPILLAPAVVILAVVALVVVGAIGRSVTGKASPPTSSPTPSPTPTTTPTTTRPTTPPAPPLAPSLAAPVVLNRSSVYLRWHPGDRSRPTGYVVVWKAADSRGFKHRVVSGNATTTTITGLRTRSTPYCFAVTSLFRDGSQSKPSRTRCTARLIR